MSENLSKTETGSKILLLADRLERDLRRTDDRLIDLPVEEDRVRRRSDFWSTVGKTLAGFSGASAIALIAANVFKLADILVVSAPLVAAGVVIWVVSQMRTEANIQSKEEERKKCLKRKRDVEAQLAKTPGLLSALGVQSTTEGEPRLPPRS